MQRTFCAFSWLAFLEYIPKITEMYAVFRFSYKYIDAENNLLLQTFY